ncbi:hypothetical protein Pst134EA_032667 [Puccinia striiformis f. sp. tritici]|uniref:uncharacterized protein n=1 Tax=Puccinia striiformis f. sp. tritici TaxID=168172 RepID=UPI0020087E33|nr:uncharacterized protein Pst134EA_032667 [Puccinia striiformis f. sp. tritici]KAH9441677.1 hypothetical protein Pst134EA_032667 [Puccinia striiformis f. sp. tritici]
MALISVIRTYLISLMLERSLKIPVNINFLKVDDLAEIWIEWAEMEDRNENYSEALRVIRRATIIPINYKKKSISFS